MATSVPRRTRAVCMTLNNPSVAEVARCEESATTHCTYAVIGREIGERGTPHLQMYVEFPSPRALTSIKKYFGDRVHVEERRGTPKQASDYCKKDGQFKEFGQISSQGERTDWHTVVADISAGKDIATVVTENPQTLRCIRALERFQQLTLKPRVRELQVWVFFGAPGTGKSRLVRDIAPDVYSKPEGLWWDGYKGQKDVVLDDYNGEIPWTQFLKILDRYPISLPVKGGFVEAQYERVFITSNKDPVRWYPGELFFALQRRIGVGEWFMYKDDYHRLYKKYCLPYSITLQNADETEDDSDP